MNLHSIRTFYFSSTGCRRRLQSKQPSGFTLVELLLSLAILSILLVVITNVIGVVQKTWVRANSRVSQFREARMAFDAMTRSLSQATLNSYWQNEFDVLGPVNVEGTNLNSTRARSYVRESELQFVCGQATTLLGGGAADYPGHAVFFQAPFGVTNMTVATGMVNTENMVNLLSGRGYFVNWGNDLGFRPPFLDPAVVRPRYRYRLMEYSPTAESNRIYDSALRPITDHRNEWFQDARTRVASATEVASNRGFTRPIADNVVALIISPQVEKSNAGALPATWIAPEYAYDSTQRTNTGGALGAQGTQHQLPPTVRITMVAVDDAAAEIMGADSTSPNLMGAAGASFTSASNFEADLRQLETYLSEAPRRYNYRVYTTTVSIKQAKWSL